MNFDYAIHSDFLIHWTGKDIDCLYDPLWHELDKSKTSTECTAAYIKRLNSILKYGLWMTKEHGIQIGDFPTQPIPHVCFTELKLSESRKHSKKYGRLGVGFKRPFAYSRLGRPIVYFHEKWKNDRLLEACARELKNKNLLNFFKPMNSSNTLNYDFYGESEWRIIFFQELLQRKLIIDPRDHNNIEAYEYFLSLSEKQQSKLEYLIPLDGWFSVIIYPSLDIKNKAQQDSSNGINNEIKRIKNINDHGNKVEGKNWPIELDLDACRNF